MRSRSSPHVAIAAYAFAIAVAFSGVWLWADEGGAGVVRPLIGAVAISAILCLFVAGLLQILDDRDDEKRAAQPGAGGGPAGQRPVA